MCLSFGVLWLRSSPVEQLTQSQGLVELLVNQEREAALIVTEYSTTLLGEYLFTCLLLN
jgi:hypothetical protein